MLAVFAMSIVVFVGMCAVVLDVAWYWANTLRMQRAADAAALAGVVYLPGNPAGAITAAKAESAKNGYQDGTGGVVVSAVQDTTNNRAMRVTVSGSVGTFFMRLFGVTTIPGSARSMAEYVLPVPMGSPDSYYGVFGQLRTPSGGTTSSSTTSGTTQWLPPSAIPATVWTTPANAYSGTDADASATTSTNTAAQLWGGFGVTAAGTGTLTVTSIEVGLRAASGAASGCVLRVSLTWNGSTFSSTQDVTLSSTSFASYTAGGITSLWGTHTWTEAEITAATFRVKVEYRNAACSTAGATVRLDQLTVRVGWSRTGTVTIPDPVVTGPSGETLTPRGFWGTMLSQGAADVNGDAYLPYYETPTSTTNPDYAPTKYYDYAVYLPPGSANGVLSIFDAPFCGTDSSGQFGTGDRYFSASASPISAFYTLYDTNETLWDPTDDTVVASSNLLFRRISAVDASLYSGGTPSGSPLSCKVGDVADQTDGRYWHNRWWPMPAQLDGGTEGRTYRLRTSTTDPNSDTDQRTANAQNSFALFAKASGGAPQVYGLGAMESFSPLPGGSSSIFYLAKIEAVHAGKTVVIGLWDPGDTGALSANVQILIPGAAGYTATTVKWSSAKGTTNSAASACTGLTGTGTSITTNTGTQQKFNGCWVTIEVPIPATYTAPTPPGETEGGWWKIKYVMGGATTDTSLDVTTWQVSIRGNPVHLVLP